jgi:hypothetical protein
MKQRSVSGDSSCQPTDVLAHEDLRRASNAGAPKIAREDEPDRFSILGAIQLTGLTLEGDESPSGCSLPTI